tara:strand:+ start:2277 stop:2909 length:633 start_codon:yes stop_codon:yes gene_type:complete
MFTGIIKDIGVVLSFSKKSNDLYRLLVRSEKLSPSIDDSIAIDGVCQTLVKKENNILYFDCVKSTLEKTNFKNLKTQQKVNLELALSVGERLDGHFVTGHVSTCGKVRKINRYQNSYELEILIPVEYKKYVCREGSITINGVSLTINNIFENSFTVFVIPHSWNFTNLSYLKVGSSINVEFDILIKYLENLISSKSSKNTNTDAIREILR